jgi:ABC-type antimicrobial peptide transport system permease subunit
MRKLSDYVGDQLGPSRALSATPRDVVSMIVRQGLGLAAVGAVLGLAGSAAGGRALAAFLYEVRPWDPGVYVAAVGLLLAAAGLAALGPALRAARTHPVRALRDP